MTCAVAALCMLRLWDQSVYWFSLMSSSKYTSAIIIKISYECGMWSGSCELDTQLHQNNINTNKSNTLAIKTTPSKNCTNSPSIFNTNTTIRLKSSDIGTNHMNILIIALRIQHPCSIFNQSCLFWQVTADFLVGHKQQYYWVWWSLGLIEKLGIEDQHASQKRL